VQLVCPACNSTNRVPDDRVGDDPRCGQCGQPLMASEPMPLPGSALDKFVTATELPVVVDFWAEWCGPCKMMAPAFADAARQRPRVRFVKVDSDEAQSAAQAHGIRSIPTLIIFRGGREVARMSGAVPARQLVAWIDQQLAT
jgi:thioredoxin 2